MLDFFDRLQSHRWAHLCVINLRILLGFAFLPAGLKKVLGQPFTDPDKTGPFHDFLDAFFATGFFYQFVGGVQVLIAVLLMTQTFTALGALLTLPVITTITVFCWSTGVVPTATVVTAMLFGTVGLILWEKDRFLALVDRGEVAGRAVRPFAHLIDHRLWRSCGTAILVFYGAACLLDGGIYRPRGVDFGHPGFAVLLLIASFPVITLIIEHRRRGSR